MTVSFTNHQFVQLMSLIKTDQEPTKSLADCTARFDHDHIKTFLAKIKLYKKVEKVSDKDALESLPLLLEGEASAWWDTVDTSFVSWAEALQMLEKRFSQSKVSCLKRKNRDFEENFQTEKKHAPMVKSKVSRCKFCRSRGHQISDCPKFKSEPKEPPEPEQKQLDNPMEAVPEDDKKNVLSGHDERQKRIIEDMIREYSDLFKPTKERPLISGVEHCIDTGQTLPISMLPYTFFSDDSAILKKTIDFMLHRGIIEECESSWAAALAVIVPTEDGESRCSIDFRNLNEVTLPDSYSMPTVEELLQEYDRVDNQIKYMATLSLPADATWQIPISKKDQPKTAFVTPFGRFMFRVLPPASLKNTAATSQKLVDKIKASLPSSCRIMAINATFVILADSLENYAENLRQLFLKLREFKISLEQDCFEEVLQYNYLGHLVTPGGIFPNFREKTKAIRKMPPPSTVKQLELFLKTCFSFVVIGLVTGLEKIAEPLVHLIMKDVTWTWGSDEQEAFTTLKRFLVEPPVFWQQADSSRPYIVHTSASDKGIGAVLVQLQGEWNYEHPIEYASRPLTPEERGYPITERKLLAVEWAAHKFCDYLHGASTKVVVTTDHEPARWLMSLRAPVGRLINRSLHLQKFDLDLQYQPSDSYTRLVDLLVGGSQEPEEADVLGSSIELPARSAEKTRVAQREDDQLREIIEAFELNGKFEQFTSRGYILSKGLLYKYSSTEKPQLVVPESERASVIWVHHDQTHCGPEETENKIVEKYFWLGLRRQVISHVKACIECKSRNSKKKQAPRFSEILVIELFGPLRKDTEGHKWILVTEDVATGWVELIALKEANPKNCAKLLVDEVFMRYGVPKQIIFENRDGVEMSWGIEKLLFCLKIKLSWMNEVPVQRKNKKILKAQLATLIKNPGRDWSRQLSAIRFVVNQDSALPCFGHELRSAPDTLKNVVNSERSIPEIDHELLRLAETLRQVKEIYEKTTTSL